MAIELVTKFAPYVDEVFSTEGKSSLVTNKDFDFDGAHAVKVYKVSTGDMYDYGRSGPAEGQWSRYGVVESLDATTDIYTLSKDRSFTFVIDTLDQDETGQALEAASALARQIREKVVPEVDTHTFKCISENAGTKPEAITLTSENVYGEIIKGNMALDDAEVPETGRVLVITPAICYLMKQCKDIILNTETGQDMVIKGVIGNLDGLLVVRVPAARLPKDFGFMIAHPCATVAPTKLESYMIHSNPPGINGTLVEGRIVYDAFVMKNKAKAIYYQANKTADADATGSGKTE